MSTTVILASVMGFVIIVATIGLFYFLIKYMFPNTKFFFKYKILKKKPNEEYIEFLVEEIEKGTTIDHIMKEALLTNKYSMKQAFEMQYLFLEVEKNLKGGKKE